MKLFHEDTNTVTPSDGIKKLKFDPKTHKYGFSLAGNTKVGRIATWSTPMGDYTYKGLTGVLKDTKLPVGIGAEDVATVKFCVENGVVPDFWVLAFHSLDYPAARMETVTTSPSSVSTSPANWKTRNRWPCGAASPPPSRNPTSISTPRCTISRKNF